MEAPAGRETVRCLLDGGSQKSFIHEDVVKALIRQETLNNHTSGCTSPVAARRSIVRGPLENVWNTEREIEAVETCARL